MQTRQTIEISEPTLKVTYKKQGETCYKRMLFKEMQPLLKMIIFNNELLNEVMGKDMLNTKTSLNAIACTKKIQKLLDQYLVLDNITSGSPGCSSTVENPKLIFEEVKDRTGLKICFSKPQKKDLFINADHQLLIDALVTLVMEIDNGDQIEFNVNTYIDQSDVCFKISFDKSISDELENSLTFQYVMRAFGQMHATYERSTNRIVIKFKKGV